MMCLSCEEPKLCAVKEGVLRQTQADSGSIINIVLHDAIAIAQDGCSYGWAAQVFRCFAEHGRSSPLVAGAPIEVQR